MADFSLLREYGVDDGFIRRCLDSYKKSEVTVAVTGEFSSGKTCLINAILGKRDFLPDGDSECTPIYVDISRAGQNSLSVIRNNNDVDVLDFTTENIELYARYSPEHKTDALALIVGLPDFSLGENIHLFDCPGTNTIIPEHERITGQVVQRSDLLLYVCNKNISGESLKRISELYDLNEDVIFVLTHMDTPNGESMLPDEIIDKYMNEARYLISDKLGISAEKVRLFYIGSKHAFTDPCLVEKIKSEIIGRAQHLQNGVLKDKAKEKILTYLNSELSKEEERLSLIRAAKGPERAELMSRIENTKRNVDLIRKGIEQQRIQIDSTLDDGSSRLMKRMNTIAEDCSQRTVNRINLRSCCSADDVSSELDAEIKRYDREIRTAIRSAIKKICTDEYGRVSDELKKLGDSFAVSTESLLNITPPTDIFEEKMPESENVAAMHRNIKQKQSEIEDLETQRQIELRDIESVNSARNAAEDELVRKKAKRIEHGSYRPQFVTEIKKGGGNIGAGIGKMAGFIADAALLLYNPTGGLAALDSLKDIGTLAAAGTKIAEAVVTENDIAASEDSDGLEFGLDKEPDSGNESVSGSSNGDGNVPAGDKGGNGSNKSGESKALRNLSSILSMVSLTSWGEKAGRYIGDHVKPQRELKKENLEKREEYFARAEQLDSEIAVLESNIREYEDKARDKMINSEILIRLKDARQALEVMQQVADNEEIENKKKSDEKKHNQEKKYYCSLIEAAFLNLAETNGAHAADLFEQARICYHSSSSCAAEVKLDEMEKLLETLKGESNQLDNELDSCSGRKRCLMDLKNSVDELLGLVKV